MHYVQLLESRGNQEGINAEQLSHEASDGRKTTGFSSKEREEPLEKRGGERTEFVLKDFVPGVECWVDVSVLCRKLVDLKK